MSITSPIRYFDLASCPAQPWKNGRGTTRELCAHLRDGRTIWRFSIADIDRNGAFSVFPGLMRTQVIVAGGGLLLSGKDTQIVARPRVPVSFAGDAALMAELVGGACRAFNVMFDPMLVRADTRVIGPGIADVEADLTVHFVIEGRMRLGPDRVLKAGQGAVVPPTHPVRVLADSCVIETGLVTL